MTPQQIIQVKEPDLLSILNKSGDSDNQQKPPVLQKVSPGAGGAMRAVRLTVQAKALHLKKWL